MPVERRVNKLGEVIREASEAKDWRDVARALKVRRGAGGAACQDMLWSCTKEVLGARGGRGGRKGS